MDIGLSSPWMIHANKIKELFRYDDEVRVEVDGTEVTLYVDNPTKADAIDAAIIHEVDFGNVTLNVKVVPANQDITTEQLFRLAFDGNPVFAGSVYDDVHDITFALFQPAVAQFHNDDISSAFGVATMTYEDIARDVLGEDDGAFVCSDILPTID